MKAPEVIKLSFDPKTTEDRGVRSVFMHRTAWVLWCCIKHQHVVPSGFNDLVLRIAKALDEERPRDYDEFVRKAHLLTSKYGRATVYSTTLIQENRIDNEFWGGVWMALRGIRCCRYEVELPKEKVT